MTPSLITVLSPGGNQIGTLPSDAVLVLDGCRFTLEALQILAASEGEPFIAERRGDVVEVRMLEALIGTGGSHA